jgi:hypothetical protein
MTRRCVLYIRNGREHQTPWFYCAARVRIALAIIVRKHGNGIIYVD